MKKFLTILLAIFLLLFTFSSCEIESCEVFSVPKLPETDNEETELPYLKAPQKGYSEEDLKGINSYYNEMKRLFPEIEDAPLDTFDVSYTHNDKTGAVSISFKLFIGGLETGFQYSFEKTSESDFGNWNMHGLEYLKYANFKLTQEDMDNIYSYLENRAKDSMNKNNMIPERNSSVYWTLLNDGELAATCEWIARRDPSSPKSDDGEDHSHIIKSVPIKFENGKMILPSS